MKKWIVIGIGIFIGLFVIIGVIAIVTSGDGETISESISTEKTPLTTTPESETATTTSEPEESILEEPEKPVVEKSEITEADFRNVNWGMSKAEVKDRETEGKIVLEKSTGLVFSDISLAGLDAVLGYVFNVEDQLFAANYLIKEQHINNTAYITDYKFLKDKLIDKYGVPDKDEIIWLDDLWKDEPNKWGMAVVTGDLTYYSLWELDSLRILLMLQGDNYEVDFKLMYQNTDISNDTGKPEAEGL